MLSWFRRKKKQLRIHPQNKAWVEGRFEVMIAYNGQQPWGKSVFLRREDLVGNNPDLRDAKQFRILFQKICKRCRVNPDLVTVVVCTPFEELDEVAIARSTAKPLAGDRPPIDGVNRDEFLTILVPEPMLGDPDHLIWLLASECLRIHLYAKEGRVSLPEDYEWHLDLFSTFFGFGIFVSNAFGKVVLDPAQRFSVMALDVTAYANALLCWINGIDPWDIADQLSPEARDLMLAAWEFLEHTHDSELTEEVLGELREWYDLLGKIFASYYTTPAFERETNYKKALKRYPDDGNALNGMGYAVLEQKRYEESLEWFEKAIAAAPDFDYPVNNLGYAYLQMGQLVKAKECLDRSLAMNRNNAFVHRNLGDYCLEMEDWEAALAYFQAAQRIEPEAELINFYLAIAYKALGDTVRGDWYAQHSRAIQ